MEEAKKFIEPIALKIWQVDVNKSFDNFMLKIMV